MRNFNEADKEKKKSRIQIKENPGNLSREALSQVEDKLKASSRDGHLPCGTAHKIAQETGVPKIAVGQMADKLGIRIINCQIGCFKVDKTVHANLDNKIIDDKIIAELETLNNNDNLNCANVFELARELKLTPMAIADVANFKNLRIYHCQLGCF